jgi:hypothetical protein
MSAANATVPAAAAVHTSRPGKAVLDQTGAAASPVAQAISASGRHDLAPLANMTVLPRDGNTAGRQHGNGTTSACHHAWLPVSIPSLRQG